MKGTLKGKLIHLLTIFLLVFSLLTPGLATPQQSLAATPTDVTGHWAYTYIARGIQLGFISGYPDGTFLPDKAVSRAEFAKMMNAALGNTGTATTSFKDVPAFEWFYNDVSKAVAATYVDGYGDGTFLPNKAISRQEAAVMIARIVPSYGVTANLAAYKDGSKTADWAGEYMKKIVGKGYLGAYDDGLLHPDDSLTRAQTAKIICSILDKETIVKTLTTIKTSDNVAKNTLYTNAITLSKDLAEGNATFQNCSLLGGLIVNGGGKATITLENSRVTLLNVNKADSRVRVLVKGATTIPQTQTQETCTLETASLAGGIFGKGFASVDIKRNADTTLTGFFPLVNMVGSSGIARLEGCSVTSLVVSSDAKNANVHLDSRSAVAATDVNAVSAFHGTGTIKQMNANVSGITYETKPTNWTLASGVVAPSLTNPDLKAAFVPDNGATGIALAVKPTITFSSEIETFKGEAITASYLKDNLVFKKSSATGADVSFTAAINSDKKTVTITPTRNLDSNQAYYIGFAKDKFRSIGTKESIPPKSIVFTTLNNTPTVSIIPVNGAVQFATNGSLKVTFSEAVFTSTGAAVTKAYLAENITVVKDSGGNLNTSAATSIVGNVVTIAPPTGGWDDGGSYTITVKGSSFKNAAGINVGQTISTFIAGNAVPTMTLSLDTPGSSSVSVNASSTIPGRGYFVVTEVTSGAVTPSAAYIKDGKDSAGITLPSGNSGNGTIGTGSSSFSLTGLSSGKTYTVYGVTFANGKDSVVVSSTSFIPLPEASLSSLVCSYTASGGAMVSTEVLDSGTINVNIPADAVSIAAISIRATAPSEVNIAFTEGTTGNGVATLSSSIDMSSSESVTITITTSKTNHTPTTYKLTLTKSSS